MQKRYLSQLIKQLNNISGDFHQDTEISSIVFDSRSVEEKSLFFALPGVHTDGHAYIDSAIDAGAIGIVHSQPINNRRPGIIYIKVPDTRAALSPVSAAFYDSPSKSMTVIGVTGTDGKSTTVELIRQLLELSGKSAGSISTVNFSIGGQLHFNHLRQSTPEAPQIHRLLREMLDAGQEYAVLEATSHGLSKRNSRLEDVHFDVAVLTNVTSEHQEFHGSFKNYLADKARLFQMIAQSKNRDAFAVVNADDPNVELFIDAAGEKPVFTFSIENPDNDLSAEDLYPDAAGSDFSLVTPMGRADTRINLPGQHNVENLLAALCTVAELLGRDPLDLLSAIPKLSGLRGRMENIAGNMEFTVIVDYAHSPGSFSKILPFLKSLSRKRLIAVFGSAGERDTVKRPVQGRIASEYADIIYLTDEDPRSEDPMKILEDIAGGIDSKENGRDLFLIPERREAIAGAFKSARAGDCVVVLGKGQEPSIIKHDGPVKWDDAEVCREILQEMGYEI